MNGNLKLKIMRFKINKNEKKQVVSVERERVNVTENGLKCDNENCDFKNEEIKSVDYEKWINIACPKCNENLLTYDDYINVRTLEAVIEMTNNLSDEEFKQISDLSVKVKPNFLKDISDLDLNKKISVQVNTHKNIYFEKAKVISEDES